MHDFVSLSVCKENRRLKRGETKGCVVFWIGSWTERGVSGETGEIRVKAGV